MKLRTFTAAVFGLVLATSALAFTLQTNGGRTGTPPDGTASFSLARVPAWVADGFKLAWEDATNPRAKPPGFK